MTSTMRSRSAMNASTRSPARTFVDGFAGDPFTRTWPPSHNRVASGRVFTRRTAHSQRSIRVCVGGEGVSHRPRMARLAMASRRPCPPRRVIEGQAIGARAARKPDHGSGFGLSREWSGREDLNLRPYRPERYALPSCATPRPVPVERACRMIAQAGANSRRPRNRPLASDVNSDVDCPRRHGGCAP